MVRVYSTHLLSPLYHRCPSVRMVPYVTYSEMVLWLVILLLLALCILLIVIALIIFPNKINGVRNDFRN